MTIDKQALREAAERAMHDDWGYDTDIFHEQVTPSVVLALLDELEAETGYREGAFIACNRWHDKFRETEQTGMRRTSHSRTGGAGGHSSSTASTWC
ncbi:ead/Ea22-like family protein [Salmonella enterica subsp. enterica serovar Texas]|nr:ead/Ea22-like family protein [Salmonella enterica subsp. enterica serovar Texas]